MKTTFASFLALLLLVANVSCGNLKTSSPNDQAPSGTIVATGTFSGSIGGTVSIYDTGSGAYVIRLVSFSAPSESGLQMIPSTPGGPVGTFTLRATSGNTNYNYSGTANTVWRGGKVVIHSVQQNRDLGEAPLL